nr:unnamed protein product [Callosobruchus analis]
MSCDSVEDCGMEIVKSCYDLHHKAKYDLIKERLLLLLMYAKRWRPICSVAGICHMNKGLMVTVLSTVVTYFVVIIQFNSVVNTTKA